MNPELRALVQKYFEDSLKGEGLGTEWSYDDFQPIRDFVWQKFPTYDDQAALRAFLGFEDEFTRGHRCSVCGMTQAQSKAANYDCVREC